MIKHIIIAFLLSVFSISILSASEIKDKEVDSLLQSKKFVVQERILDSLVNIYRFSKPNIGLKLSKRYAELVKGSNDIYHQGNSNYYLGLAYEMIGEYEKSLEYLFKARDIFITTDYQKNLATVYNELGMVYCNQSDKQLNLKAFEYFNSFLEISLAINDKMEIAGAYSNIGWLYSNLKQMDSAIYYHEKSLEIRLELNDKRSIGISYSNMGDVNSKLGKYILALEFFQKAIIFYKDIDYSWGMFEVNFDIAHLYLKQQIYDSVDVYIFKSLDICHDMESKYAYQRVYYFLADYYKQISDFKTSLEYYELSIAYQDSISSESTKNKLIQLQTIYELGKKEQAIELLEQKNRVKQKWVITIIVGGLTIIIIIVYVLFLVSAKRKKEKEVHYQQSLVLVKEKELSQSELEKSQIQEEELKKEIQYKSKQLTTHALNMMQKNTLMQEIQEELIVISKKASDDNKPVLSRIKMLIKKNLRSEKDWDLFKMYFEDVNKKFYQDLAVINPDLTSNDLKLCALLKLNMNIKESASVMNIEPASVKTARYKLRKKLNLMPEDDLVEVIRKIG